MKPQGVYILFITYNILLLFGCNTPNNTVENNISAESIKKTFELATSYTITGNLNNDSIQDTLTWLLEGIKRDTSFSTFEDMIQYVSKSSNALLINNTTTKQQLVSGPIVGLYFLHNEGDLNNDGTDELSYVVDWADQSTLNTYHIITNNNNEWKELYSFPIWEWQIDSAIANNTSLVTSTGPSTFRCTIRNAEAMEETVEVELDNKSNQTNETLQLIIKDSLQYDSAFINDLHQFGGPSTIELVDSFIIFNNDDTTFIPQFHSCQLTARNDSIAVALTIHPKNMTTIKYKLEYHNFGSFTHFYNGEASIQGLFFLGSENDVSSISNLGYGSTEYSNTTNKHSIQIRLGYEEESGNYLLGRVLLNASKGDTLDFSFPTLVEK